MAMLWRVRTTVADTPGALARLAVACGEAGVNILGFQIFPGLVGVTDELVVRVPRRWQRADVIDLFRSTGFEPDLVAECTANSLVDQTIRHLRALQQVVDDPSTLGEHVADLLDATLEPPADSDDYDEVSVPVADQVVTVRRTAPFAHTEYARISAFADLVTSLTEPAPERSRPAAPAGKPQDLVIRPGMADDADGIVAMIDRCSMETVYLRFDSPLSGLHPRMARRLMAEDTLVAVVSGPHGEEIIGLASLSADEIPEVGLIVEDRWQRKAIGRRLLVALAKRAKARGRDQIMIRTRPEHPAVMSLVRAAGFMGRLTYTGDHLEVRMGLRNITPDPVPA